MSQPFKSQQELYQIFIDALQNSAPQLTDINEGSMIDIIAGAFSVGGTELQRYNVAQFNKTFIDLANGPEVTGGDDDLETLVVDHFGSVFARPAATNAVDTATFSRANNSKGAITIPAGSIVKTAPDANGTAQRYSTNGSVTLTNSSSPSDLTISVGITAVVAGSASNATVGTINVIETTLLDPSIVVTNAGNATGADAQDDAEYRETIRNLIVALRAATKSAIEAAAKAVSGVVVATAIEIEKTVITYNPATATTSGSAFQIPFVTLYIADATGSASPTLIAEVQAAIDPIRAYGVFIDVESAVPVSVNWSAQLTLNPSGPNFPTLTVSTAPIVQSMTQYIATLGAGVSFVRATAEAAILAIWGSGGSNDLTAFHTTVPGADVSIDSTHTAVPGTVQTV